MDPFTLIGFGAVFYGIYRLLHRKETRSGQRRTERDEERSARGGIDGWPLRGASWNLPSTRESRSSVEKWRWRFKNGKITRLDSQDKGMFGGPQGIAK